MILFGTASGSGPGRSDGMFDRFTDFLMRHKRAAVITVSIVASLLANLLIMVMRGQL